MKANEILDVLYQFKSSSYQKILINGTWGIGKTKYISDFINNYPNSCYVSLFGKKDVNSIIQEIYFKIIEQASNGNFKKRLNLLREKMGKFDVSLYGFSLSIPVIEDLHNTLNKELNRKDEFIIVFDDLERKHQDLDIKEIFGVVDSLSKIEDVKIILVSALEQFDGEVKDIFKSYQEKAIDRIYKIEKFADEAPMQILGESVWEVIETFAEDLKFSNLRTFEKISLFIKEVTQTLGEGIFSDRFTRADLYRMCFASVFFVVEQNSEMKLINELSDNNQNSTWIKAVSSSGDSGIVEYLNRYILKNSTDNVMSKNLFPHIKIWYETGSFNKSNIMSLITSINTYEEEPHNFYSSESEILAVINSTKEQITNLTGKEDIEYFINKLSNAFDWCEILSVDFGISNNDIAQLLEDLIKIDITKSLHEHDVTRHHRFVGNHRVRTLIEQINDIIKSKYCTKLLDQIDIEIKEESYIKSFLKQLDDLLFHITDEDKSLRALIIDRICDSDFFFPIPSNKISESKWSWCHSINDLMINIERQWKVPNLHEKFKLYVYSLTISKTDKMLQHRLRHLFETDR
ncbi:Uncharacterised protein [Actinobacillus pleuropneumoniae]|nr:Uncharacterised protein [Actinobacillus pleuropneumoniae]